MPDVMGLRLDDVGAASKRHEVYSRSRLGNVLFLKYVPPFKAWGPYRELTASEWEAVLSFLGETGSRMTAAMTAGWVETDGRIVPFPVKFPEAASVIREGVRRGLLEVANHGYTHCLLQDRLFLPRPFSGNRQYHREFYDWLPEATHREHLSCAQRILEESFATRVVTLVPPGNLFSQKTLAAAVELGLLYVSCRDAGRQGAFSGITFVDDAHVLALHDRSLVLGGLGVLREVLVRPGNGPFVTVREVGERLAGMAA